MNLQKNCFSFLLEKLIVLCYKDVSKIALCAVRQNVMAVDRSKPPPSLFLVRLVCTDRLSIAIGSWPSFSRSVIDAVIKIKNLRTVPVECHDDDTPLIFYDTLLSSLLILLVYVSKFNVHDTSITLPLRLAL